MKVTITTDVHVDDMLNGICGLDEDDKLKLIMKIVSEEVDAKDFAAVLIKKLEKVMKEKRQLPKEKFL